MERVCERCGGVDDDLVAVRPVEDRSDSWEEPLELWCFSCRSELPAETAEPAD
ncbi:MAG: hypothetical protein M3179_06970 [Actinomycetota bacterium]|nr:hypothetical protein [Actinomycetota bacterium]